ncbi:hypothetical protein PHYPSEUDO_013145 [Phytophthora pseudosyringae]|uniref:Uncharacterized protein n=1 Tax=Phytophthora pseudosyringae TaxID=221518 RepID=A0A8T1V903_9STRA|nr:hypothetical protein PHYPSEUDO_013145 [Phytophthora pseudosyringae]
MLLNFDVVSSDIAVATKHADLPHVVVGGKPRALVDVADHRQPRVGTGVRPKFTIGLLKSNTIEGDKMAEPKPAASYAFGPRSSTWGNGRLGALVERSFC